MITVSQGREENIDGNSNLGNKLKGVSKPELVVFEGKSCNCVGSTQMKQQKWCPICEDVGPMMNIDFIIVVDTTDQTDGVQGDGISRQI